MHNQVVILSKYLVITIIFNEKLNQTSNCNFIINLFSERIIMSPFLFSLSILISIVGISGHSHSDLKNDPRSNGGLALWIDEKQVKMFSGL